MFGLNLKFGLNYQVIEIRYSEEIVHSNSDKSVRRIFEKN